MTLGVRMKRAPRSEYAVIAKNGKQRTALDERVKKADAEKEACLRFERIVVPTTHRVIHGDSRRMPELADSSVHLVVTSPPYYNAKSYSQWSGVDSYLDDMRGTFAECFRVLQDSRKFCLNISDLPVKGESGVRWMPLGPRLLETALDIGFELVDRVFWFKTPLKGFQYGSLPYPPSPLINDSVEYVYILRKPGKPDYKYVPKDIKAASRIRRDEYVEFTKQIWSMRRVMLKDNIGGHIAPFPEDLPMRCIKLYSFVGDTVLDPFGGRGTTAKAAMDHKRCSVVYEKDAGHIKQARRYLQPKQSCLTENKAELTFEKQ